MVIFHSYVSLPEGSHYKHQQHPRRHPPPPHHEPSSYHPCTKKSPSLTYPDGWIWKVWDSIRCRFGIATVSIFHRNSESHQSPAR